MKPLIILSGIFSLSLVILRLFNGGWDFPLSGRIAMSAMLLFTTIGHFTFSKGMQLMLPHFIPFKNIVIVSTGLIEIAAAIGLLIHGIQELTGWLLILFFLLILPANISAALRHIDYQKGTATGLGLVYLWFRIPLQIFFIAWVYWFAIRG